MSKYNFKILFMDLIIPKYKFSIDSTFMCALLFDPLSVTKLCMYLCVYYVYTYAEDLFVHCYD